MTDVLTLDNYIAYRTFTLADNPNQTLCVLIGKPVFFGENEWHCPYRIVGADYDICSAIIGVDAIQALQLVFGVIDSVILAENLDLLWLDKPFVGFCQNQ